MNPYQDYMERRQRHSTISGTLLGAAGGGLVGLSVGDHLGSHHVLDAERVNAEAYRDFEHLEPQVRNRIDELHQAVVAAEREHVLPHSMNAARLEAHRIMTDDHSRLGEENAFRLKVREAHDTHVQPLLDEIHDLHNTLNKAHRAALVEGGERMAEAMRKNLASSGKGALVGTVLGAAALGALSHHLTRPSTRATEKGL